MEKANKYVAELLQGAFLFVSSHETVISRHETVISWHDTTVSRHITYQYITILSSVSRLYYLSIFTIKQSNNILYVFG